MNGHDETIGEKEYVVAVEKTFSRLRRRPLILSPADLARVQRWRRLGLPLELVVETMQTVYRRLAERRPPRLPATLAYVEPAIEEAAAALADRRTGRRAEAPAERDRDREALLALFARAAAGVRASSVPEEARGAVAAALDLLAEGRNPLPDAADPVAALERRLVEAADDALDADERAELDAAAAADVEPYAASMPDGVRRRAIEKARARRLRRRFGWPDLARLPLVPPSFPPAGDLDDAG